MTKQYTFGDNGELTNEKPTYTCKICGKSYDEPSGSATARERYRDHMNCEHPNRHALFKEGED